MNKKNNNVIDFSRGPGKKVAEPKPAESKPEQQVSESYVSLRQAPIIKWTMKIFGWFIKSEKQAYYFILGLVIISFIVTIFLIFGGEEKKSPEETFSPAAEAPAEEVIPPNF